MLLKTTYSGPFTRSYDTLNFSEIQKKKLCFALKLFRLLFKLGFLKFDEIFYST